MKYSRKRIGLAIMLAQSAMVIPYAQAELEEIIVTAERREASLQETDISISAFSENTLQELGVTNYLDLASMAPNVMMHEMPGKAGGAISIRGFKNAETISTFEPKVGLYLDGVVVAKGAGSVFDVMDLERVEILRGPQGTLYGRNSAGGAVNFITKKPEHELGGKIGVSLGDYGKQDLKGTLNLPLLDNLAMRASVGTLKSDGYFQNRDSHPNDGITIQDSDLGWHDRKAAHVQFLWEPAENLDILYAYDMTDIDEDTYPIALVGHGPTQSGLAPYVTDGKGDREFNFTDSFMRSEVNGHNLTANLDINENLSLVSITSYRTIDVDNAADSDGSPRSILNNYSGDDLDTWTQELRLVGSAMDDRLEYVAGAFYMDEAINDYYTGTGLGGFGITQRKQGEAKNENWALFGQATYSLTEKLDLTLGGRYTEEDKSMTRTDSNIAGITNSGAVLGTPRVFPEAQNDFDNISGLASLNYQWTDDVMTYFKIAQGYVSGGFNPRSPTTGLTQAQILKAWGDGYDEETLDNYELGWKTTVMDGRLRINGAIFYIDYSDLQVNQLTETGQNNIDNAGDATLQGAELEVVAMLSENLEMGGGYGYLDPEYDTYIDTGGNDLSNNHWAHAPENTFNAYARYEIPNFQNIGNLVFRADYSWIDDHFLLTANPPLGVDKNVSPGYEFINARMSLDSMVGPNGSAVSVALWGKNLTDELWYTSGYDLSDGALGFVGKAVAPPRTFGVDLNVEF